MKNIAVIGCGYWGPNLVRNVAAIPGAVLKAICDLDQEKLNALKTQYPYVETTRDYRTLLADPEIDAVVVALVPALHYEVARQCLEAGKHVMVEKPLAMNSQEGEQLVDLARSKGLVLMVGHTFVYNSIVRKIKEFIDSGEIGDLYYIYSHRLNLGQVRKDVNVLWNLAPHDFSIISYWMGQDPISVTARGFDFIGSNHCDVAFVSMEFPGNRAAHVHVSWLDPQKIRKMTIVGSRRMLVYDDIGENKLFIYDKGFDRLTNQDRSFIKYDDFGEFQLIQRVGDLVVPSMKFREPLRVECEAFVEAIEKGTPSPSDGIEGLRVLRWLEHTQRSIDSGGETVRFGDCQNGKEPLISKGQPARLN